MVRKVWSLRRFFSLNIISNHLYLKQFFFSNIINNIRSGMENVCWSVMHNFKWIESVDAKANSFKMLTFWIINELKMILNWRLFQTEILKFIQFSGSEFVGLDFRYKCWSKSCSSEKAKELSYSISQILDLSAIKV